MTPLPDGFRLVLDRSVRSFRGGTVLTGGHPGRLITLTEEGVDALHHLLGDDETSESMRRLGHLLVDAGMAHPQPAPTTLRSDPDATVTVVVPVRDRRRSLDRCLTSLGTDVPVVVVDDGSRDPASVAEVCHRHGARLIRRTINGGPGAARNEALSAITTDLVAFVDSDCVVTPHWLRALTWLFDDPDLAAVAPRIRPDRGVGPYTPIALSRFSDAHSALDMGPEQSEVGPDRLVRYVPTAALVVRRAAVPGGFDTGLRVGEDVDLVWRLLETGWRVRYEPSTTVHHREPSSWKELLARRFRYGTSAGPLAQRHQGRLAPVELRPWPAAAVAAGLAGRRRLALALVAGSAALLARNVHGHGIPVGLAIRWSAESAGWTLVGAGHAATVLAAPALAMGAIRSKRGALVAAVLLLTPPAVEWWRRRPQLDLVRWSVASIADDVAYGAGVWAGCIRSHTFGPVVPTIRLRGTPET